MPAQTLFKMAPADHQALQALLKRLAGEITPDEFRAILLSQGRLVKDIAPEQIMSILAKSLVRAVS